MKKQNEHCDPQQVDYASRHSGLFLLSEFNGLKKFSIYSMRLTAAEVEFELQLARSPGFPSAEDVRGQFCRFKRSG